jgi:hypothetical protein
MLDGDRLLLSVRNQIFASMGLSVTSTQTPTCTRRPIHKPVLAFLCAAHLALLSHFNRWIFPCFAPRSVDRSAALALSPLRSHYPSSVWRAVTRLFPERQDEKPVCVDVSVGTPEGRAGVELARRGFHVIGVEADSGALARTFRYAQAQAEVDRAPTSMEFITAKVEPQMLPDGRADLTSFFHCRFVHVVSSLRVLQAYFL